MSTIKTTEILVTIEETDDEVGVRLAAVKGATTTSSMMILLAAAFVEAAEALRNGTAERMPDGSASVDTTNDKEKLA